MANFPQQHFNNAFTNQMGKNLQELGFVVIDNVLDTEWKDALRQEICKLFEMNLLYSNRTYYEGRKSEEGKFVYGYSVMKPNVFELDLFSLPAEKRQALPIPYLNRLYADKSMIERINALIPELRIDTLDIKVQYNSGHGGCFPLHFDTTQQVSNRHITGTLYLNPDWKEEDGGQLRVFPFPYNKVDVEPIDNRLVLFSSHQTLHRVMPANSPRVCITLWFSSSDESVKKQPLPVAKISWLKGVEGIGFILNPSNRKFLSKIVFDKDWVESIEQSFGSAQQEEINKILETHRKEINQIKAQLGTDVLAFVSECLPLAFSDEFKDHSKFKKPS